MFELSHYINVPPEHSLSGRVGGEIYDVSADRKDEPAVPESEVVDIKSIRITCCVHRSSSVMYMS